MDVKKQFVESPNGLLIRAPAKINLSLLIAGKRPDGFHQIETIMAKVDFFDELLIQNGQREGIELVCEGPHWAPEGKENLIYQACEMLLSEAASKADIKITLTKNIPAGSGLGSASSDAAAALLGLNRFLKLNVQQGRLHEMAATLGSDVAFFLGGPLALCSGKGEKIEKLEENFEFLALLVLPEISVATKKVYANYRHDSAVYEKLSGQIKNYLQKNRIDLVSGLCANMLLRSCFDLDERLAEQKKRIESLDIGPLALSGSGSAMFCIFGDKDKDRATECKLKLEQSADCKSIIVSSTRW